VSEGLSAERAWTAEMGAERVGSTWSGRLVGFGRWTTDAIEQETLPDGRRRRVNIGGTRAVGIETQAGWRPLRTIRLDADLTLQHVRDEDGAELPEKPSWIGRGAVAWAPPLGLNARAEGLWTGGAVGPDASGELVPLDDAPRLNLRLGYKRAMLGTLADVYLRLDNAFDSAYEPQLGLPAPGRSASVGLRVLWGS
jgi:iron complex outermembrane receptor protein